LRVGAPVAIGAGDVPCSAIAAGAVDPGMACTVLGATCHNGVVAAEPTFEPPNVRLLFTLPEQLWLTARRGRVAMTETLMAAEIAETGQALRRQLDANRATTAKLAAELRAGEPEFVATIARGSSDHASAFLKHAVELKLGLACASLGPSIASLYQAPLRLARAVAITISQSGKSPDIVAMQRAAKSGGATTIALVNDPDSPVAADADALLPLLAGEERSVAATKSMIAALVAGAALVAHWSEDADLAAALERLPGILDAESLPPPERPVRTLAAANSLFVIGRGATFAVAMEAALKLKETSAIHAEAFSSAEVLHGPAGVITPGFPVLGFAPADAARDGFFETVKRLASFGAAPLIVDVERHARWPTVIAPDAGHAMVTPIVALHAFYVLAEEVARRRGRNPDQPPHLMMVPRTV
jgi:glucosamine--fructose-6-phosphate aminotransferase (isomerizing)